MPVWTHGLQLEIAIGSGTISFREMDAHNKSVQQAQSPNLGLLPQVRYTKNLLRRNNK